MHPIPKLLIGIGLLLIVVGVVWQFGGKFLHLGRLPGDISIEKEEFRFYFPLTTSLLLSAAFSLILFIVRYFQK